MEFSDIPHQLEGATVAHAELVQLPAHSYAIVLLEYADDRANRFRVARYSGRRLEDHYGFATFEEAAEFLDYNVANAREA